MARTALLYAFPALLVVTSWLGLEEPQQGGRLLAAAALALVPALVRPWWARVLAALVGAAVVLPGAFGLSSVHGSGYTQLFGRFWNGLLAFYDVNVPFEPLSHPRMHGIVVAATFAFCLALALGIAFRRPGLASVVVAAGAAWPATLVPDRNELRLGGFVLAAVLLLYAGLRGRGAVTVRPALVAGGVVVLAAVVATSSPAVAKDAFLGWERWSIASSEPAVSVQFVWDSQYDGIRFPKKVTPVFRVAGITRPVYWRATTLDSFNGYGWREQLPWITHVSRDGRDELASDDSYPEAARDTDRWQRQVVEVAALADNHLIGASVPVAFRTPRDDVRYRAAGVASLAGLTVHGDQYAVWSYAPEPTAQELQRAGTDYPNDVLRQDLAVGAIDMPPFGTPGRSARVAALLDRFRTDDRIGAYRPLYRQAVDVAGAARTPYEAAAAVELWLRTVGGFEYDEQPPQTPGVPPLVAFVSRTKAGYCQHFAGAMALMLRYLGVPARVAAGFTSGTYETESEVWTVTDHDAHTWVEVWFEGYGWLPFDPTPERGSLNASYTASSQAFDVDRTSPRVAPLLGLTRQALQDRIARDRGLAHGAEAGTSQGSGAQARRAVRDHGPSLLVLLVLVGIAAVAVIGCAKVIIRRARYLTRDPRRIAAACRQELVDYLRDQRLDPPPGATLAEVSESLQERLSVSGRRFEAAATAARFGRPASAAAEADRSRHELRGLLRSIRRQLTAVERLRGLISLRSLGFR